MRQLLLTLLFIGGIGWSIGWSIAPTSASLLLTGVGGAGGGGGGGFVGPGNVLSGSVAWYGLRAYNAAAAASQIPAVNVRNTSSNETCDIKLAATGGLSGTVSNCSAASSGAAVATFCTPGCAVPKLYDQSGGLACGGAACDMTQATTTSQPTLTLSCQSGLPCLSYFGSGFTISSASTYAGASQPYSFSWVGQRTGAFTSFAAIQGAIGAAVQVGFSNSANTSLLFAGTAASAAAADNVTHSVQSVFNGASSVINVDGSASTVNPGATAFPATGFSTGSQNTFTGRFEEAGFWPSALTTPQQASLCLNQSAYWGLGVCGAYVGPGDLVPGATAWYGLRAYSAARATAQFHAVNVTNAANTETCDINLATTGGLSTTVSACSGASTGATLATFCSGGCHIGKLYDQSANLTDATQPTFANQIPLVLSCISTLPCFSTTGASQFLTATIASLPSPYSVSMVYDRTNSASTNIPIFATGSGFQVTSGPSANTIQAAQSTSLFSAAATDSANHSIATLLNGATSGFYIDGTWTPGSTVAVPSNTSLAVASAVGATDVNNMGEVGLWPVAFTGTSSANSLQTNALCHNQFAYWGTATSC